MFGLFKCKHPFGTLEVHSVRKEKVDEDFTKHTMKFTCFKCGKVLVKSVYTFTEGVDAFLSRK